MVWSLTALDILVAQNVDEDPYTMPVIDESKWMSGGHLGGQMQATNWAIVNCTTPANFFHVLRRQVSSLGHYSLS
jgi:2-oxoglutarate dehydrogenase E1 component